MGSTRWAGSLVAEPAPQQLNRDQRAYRRDIDGLRAIAVFAVVAYHAGLPLFHGGYIGVDIFFVISGYLIGAHVYRDIRQGRFSIAAFYQRRAKRILPALFGVLLFCYVAGIVLLSAPELKTLAEYIVATVGSASNILIWLKVNYFATGANQNPLLMTWSLGVEEQFYVFFPLMMLLLARVSRSKLMVIMVGITALSLVASALMVLKYQNATFYLLPTRAWELSFGVLLALYEYDRPQEQMYGGRRFSNGLGLVGLALLIYPIVRYSDLTTFPGLAALPPVLGATFILMSPNGWVNRHLLSRKPLVFLGLVSYSWYLWHWPLLSFARIVCDHDISTMMATAVAAVSLLMAWFSYRFVEQPFRASRTPVNLLLRKYAWLCLAFVLPALLLIASHGLPRRTPQLAAIEQQSGLRLDFNACLQDYGISSPNLSTHCVPLHDPREGIALLGDSHAGALGAALRELAQNSDMKMYEITKASCAPLYGVTRKVPQHTGHEQQCASFNRKAFDLVSRDPHIRVVWLAAYWAAPFVDEETGSRYVRVNDATNVSAQQSSANLAQGLAAMIAELKAAGKQVVVVQDDPRFAFDPVRRLRSQLMPVRGWLAGEYRGSAGPDGSVPRTEVATADYERASSIVGTVAASSARIFDLKKNLCNGTSCYFYADGRILYSDPQHLSGAGAERALQGIDMKSFPQTAEGN